jgi:hypothetical protein
MNSYLNFEQEYLQNDLVDEFQLLQNETQPRQSTSNNSFISLIKNLTVNSNRNAQNKQNQSEQFSQYTSANNVNTNDYVNSSNVAKILTTKGSAFDYMVKNRAMKNYNKTQTLKILSNNNNNHLDSQKGEVNTLTNLATQNVLLPHITTDEQLNQEDNLTKHDLSKSEELNEPNELLLEPINYTKPEPYLLLSQEDYAEHKSAILQCKLSKDGKYVASVDTNSLIKSK